MVASAYDGFFKIEKLADGVYVEVFQAGDGGKDVTLDQIIDELETEGVIDFDRKIIEDELLGLDGQKKFCVTDKTVDNGLAEGKDYKIEISNDNMRAMITFYENEAQTDYEIDPEEIEKELRSRGVVYGMDMDLIKQVAKERDYHHRYDIALGQPPVDSVPGEVEYFFKTTSDFEPEIDENGNVNFHKLSNIAHVEEDQLIAKLIPTTQGQPGRTIKDTEVPPKQAKPVRIRYGKNTRISDDKMELYASKSGLAKIIDDKVIVYNIYEVPNNVANSTGDINFDGSVIVHGNVNSGFSVKAKGDIEVNGVVEAAHLEAGGNIIVHQGIQGMGKCHVLAGGDLESKFIEQADVSVKGEIHTEAILHSQVACKGLVKVEGKKGMISGGQVRSGLAVESKILGSHMGTNTDVQVGVDPHVLQEYNEARKELPKMKEEVEKLEQVIALLNKKKEIEGDLDPQKQDMYKSAVRNKVFLANKIGVSEKRVEELKDLVDNRNKGFVVVHDVLYTGVHIGIGNMFYHVKEELKGVKLYLKGADIKMTSL